MIPVTWFFVNWRFKPKILPWRRPWISCDMKSARMGAWNRKQIIAMIIFVVMVFGWFTEKSFYDMGIYPVRLGIGVIAMAGAVAYLLDRHRQLERLPGKSGLGRGLAVCRRDYFRPNPGQHRGGLLDGPSCCRFPGAHWGWMPAFP